MHENVGRGEKVQSIRPNKIRTKKKELSKSSEINIPQNMVLCYVQAF